MEKTETQTSAVEQKKDLEGSVEFSWRNVFRGWVQNLKDDIDPAIKGAKMGFFGLHAIPTWIRQHDEGKMSSDKYCLSGLLGLVVAGSSIATYTLIGRQINEATDSAWGAAMVGVPVTAQGISWAYEAFLRAKKSETSKVVMTRLQRTLDDETAGYDLSNKQLVETLAGRLYKIQDAKVKGVIKNYSASIEAVKAEQKDDAKKKTRIEDYEREIKSLEDSLQKYKSNSIKHARKSIFYVTKNVFDGLVADGQVGKEYKLSPELETGPVKRQRDRDMENCDIAEEEDCDYRLIHQNACTLLSDIVKTAVKSKNGSAKIELFGTVTSVYTNEGKEMHYEVAPNEIWKV